MYYKWDRIFNTQISSIDYTGILAIGPSGMICPIEDKVTKLNVTFRSCVPYYDGYLLLTPGILIYTNVENLSSENRFDLKFIDGAYNDGLVILCSEDGKILYGREKLKFEDYPRKMMGINRVNNCNGNIVISGKHQIVILVDKKDSLEYHQVTSGSTFTNAYIYDNKLIALSEDGYLTIYFVDDDMNIDKNDAYRINVKKILNMVTINGMYIDYGRGVFDIYFLCDNGMVAVIPNFNYTKEMLDDPKTDLLMYATKLTSNSFFKDMIKYMDTYIIVGCGEELESCVKTKGLKDLIIQHNMLSSITGPQRYMYNFASTYESKYEGDVDELSGVITVELPVYQDEHGYYIDKKDTIINGVETEIIDVPCATQVPIWDNDKIYVNASETIMVVLNALVNSEV